MAESMIERVARAMVAADSGTEGSALFAIHLREFGDGYRSAARAAIEAMKRPVTDAMIIAGTRAVDNGQNVSEIFDDMIDAAMKGERT